MGGDAEFACKDPRGIKVSCSKTSWRYLVKHEEMKGQKGVVRAIIEKPDRIKQSAKFKDRHIYYKLLVLPSVGSAYVRVVVKIKGESPEEIKGYVINAFACSGEQKGEKLLWQKSGTNTK